MTLPKENLDNKTYADLVKEAVSRIPIYAPEWTDHNVHDPGRMFIEMFAWLAEMQIYNLNRITDRSKRKFLKLMGITELNPAKAAKVDVTFSLMTNTPTTVEAGTIVAASDPVSGEDILFETQQELLGNDAELMEIFVHTEDYFDRSDANKNENEYYYAFRSKPQKNDEFYLGFNKDPGQDIALTIHLFKNSLGERGEELQLFSSGKVRWEYWDGSEWISVEELIDNTNHLSTSGEISFTTGQMVKRTIGSNNLFWLKCVVVDDAYDIPLKIDQILLITDSAIQVKILVHLVDYFNRSDANKNENVYYYAFRSKPQKKDELYLGFNKDPGQDITLAIYLFKDGLAERGDELQLFPSGKVRWEYWDGSVWNTSEELIRFDETNHLSTSGKIRISPGTMAKSTIGGYNLFWIRCVVVDDAYDIPPKIDQILLNTVPAIQRSEVIKNKFSSSGLPDFHFEIKNVPIFDTSKDSSKDASKDGIPRITIGTEDAGDVNEDGHMEVWSKVEDFDASKPRDKHYTLDLETGRVAFGDGIHGKVPPEGENNILVSYQTGGGIRGNVKAGGINRVMADRVGPVSVTNHRSARGGEDAETLEEAIKRARIELRTPNRAVTDDDYERLAENTPGVRVKRAKALPGYYPGKKGRVPGVVSVIAVPEVQEDNVNPEPSQGFMKTVYEHLDKHRLLTTEVFVLRSGYEKISVNADVKIYPKFFGGNIEEEVTKKLNGFLHPTKGGPKGDGWPFGRAVYISEIYEIIDGVDGVDHVVSVVILTQNGVEHSDDIPIPAHSLVYPGTHQIKITVEKEAVDA